MFNHQTFWQLFRFGLIGISAAAINFLIVVLLVEHQHWLPLVANIVAYLIAVNISYIGHRFWTFGHKKHSRQSLPKFLTISFSSFLLNEALFAILLHNTELHYTFALIITILFVAMLTFIVNKIWVFK